MKLQYPTYVKNTNPNTHIIVFKKAIKANGQTMEVDIIDLFDFILKDNTLNGKKTMFNTIQIALLKSWNKHYASNSKL
jgi:hypothetical protein